MRIISFSALLGSHQLTVTNVTRVITGLIPAKLIGSHTDLINVISVCSLSRCAAWDSSVRAAAKDIPRFCFAGFFEMKMKYDESDNTLIRASRAVTDKMTDLIGERLLMDQRRCNVMLSL